MKKEFTNKELKFILDNWNKISGRALAKKMGVSRIVIRRIYKEHNIVISEALSMHFRIEAMRQKTTATPEEDVYIKANYLSLPVKTMGRHLNRSGLFVSTRLRQLGLSIPNELIEKRKRESRFQLGNVSYNKDKKLDEIMSPEGLASSKFHRFKKGNTPHNIAEADGVIRIRKSGSGRKSKWIRIKEGEWQQLHYKIWEEKHGKIEDGKVIWFKDNNSLNCDIDNMELITRQELMNRNIHQYPLELRASMQKLGKLKKLLKQKL